MMYIAIYIIGILYIFMFAGVTAVSLYKACPKCWKKIEKYEPKNKYAGWTLVLLWPVSLPYKFVKAVIKWQ